MIVNVNPFTQLSLVPTPPHPAYLQTHSCPAFKEAPFCSSPQLSPYHLFFLGCYPFLIVKFPLTLFTSPERARVPL